MLFQTTLLSTIQASFLDFPNSEDMALTVFFVGCDFRCPDCHNFYLQDYNYEDDDVKEMEVEELWNNLDEKSKRYNNTRLVVFEGGDPFATKNVPFVNEFLEYNEYKEDAFDMCIYSGYVMNELIVKMLSKKYNHVKYYITGQYDKMQKQMSEKTDTYFQLGSKNQEIYDTHYNLISKEGVYYYE